MKSLPKMHFVYMQHECMASVQGLSPFSHILPTATDVVFFFRLYDMTTYYSESDKSPGTLSDLYLCQTPI